MVVFLLLAVASGREPLPPPVPPDPVDPGSAASPYAELVPVPPIAGSATSTSIESLGTTSSRFTITADTSVVGRVTEVEARAIAMHLAAEPGWRVALYDGALGAAARWVRGGEAHAPFGGYHDSGRDVYRALIRFEPPAAGTAWATSPSVTHVAPGAGQIVADTFFLGGDRLAGFKATAIAIEGPELTFELYEARRTGSRQRTADELTVTLPLLDLLRSGVDRIASTGYHSWFMPRGEPLQGTPTVTLDSPGPGLLAVTGRANPGEPGWTWVRILDHQLVPWEEAAVAAGTRERIGWSAQADRVFYLESTFPVPRSRRQSGTAEIWFQPDAGGPPRRLLAEPVTIPKR